jgi:hypothetical protein
MKLAIVALFVLLSACNMRKETTADHVVHRGELAVLTVAGQEHVYIALAQADAHPLAAAIEANDASKLKALTDSGKVLSLPAPTPVRVLQEAYNERQVEIAVGPDEGKIGWVPYEWLKPSRR